MSTTTQACITPHASHAFVTRGEQDSDVNNCYDSQPSKLFAVDHQTGDLLTDLDAAGMLGAGRIKSARVPVLWAKDEGYHVFELLPEWGHLLAKGIKDPEVLLQFAKLRVSYRVDQRSHDLSSNLCVFDIGAPF
jgi:hypothetical protein